MKYNTWLKLIKIFRPFYYKKLQQQWDEDFLQDCYAEEMYHFYR